jgi:membrane-associated protein
LNHAALIPWLDPETILTSFGPWGVLVVCLIVFAETGLLIGFLFPGDTLLVITGLLAHENASNGGLGVPIWIICLAIGFSAFVGGEVGYLIGHKAGPRIFERKESGFFSVENVRRTNAFFERFGGLAVILARFVPIVRTFAPIAAGVAHMNYKKYSLYNLIGALIWGSGVTLLGWLLAFIPPVADFVSHYIDVILIGAVVLAIVPTLFHFFQQQRKARHSVDPETDAAEASALVLDPATLDDERRAHGGREH